MYISNIILFEKIYSYKNKNQYKIHTLILDLNYKSYIKLNIRFKL